MPDDNYILSVAHNLMPKFNHDKKLVKHSILKWVFEAKEDQVDRVLKKIT